MLFQIVFLVGGFVLLGRIGKCSKGKISCPAPLKVPFFLLSNNFSQFSHTMYNNEKQFFFFSVVIFLGGVSKVLYKFYLGTHKSGKKEKMPTTTLFHPPSLSCLIYNDR